MLLYVLYKILIHFTYKISAGGKSKFMVFLSCCCCCFCCYFVFLDKPLLLVIETPDVCES